jgi:DNA-binding response OmpR family regulator
MKARILWIEGKRAEGPPFIPSLRKKGCTVEIAATGSEALECLAEFDPDLIVINLAGMRTTGKRIVKSLRERANGVPLLAVKTTEQDFANDLGVNVLLTLPFTARKLINRIVPLLPSDGINLLHVGPIRLDVPHKRVRCQGREKTLTPRLVHLLKIFLEHPGEALERERLFRVVWNTEYTVDTRTLDVHISWLREAIEENPRRPRFIKTIRGVGYRLDIS